MYNDPSGEAFISVLFTAIKIVSSVISAVQTVKTAIGLIKGEISFSQFAKGLVFNAISAGVSFGVGEIFKAGGLMAQTFGDITFLVKAGTHAVTQGVLSSVQGNKFGEGALAGALSSLIATGVGEVSGNSQYKKSLQILSGSIAGGVEASLAKGNFWRGVQIGSIVSTYNHTLHEPPAGFEGKHYYDAETGDNYYRISSDKYKVIKLDGTTEYFNSIDLVEIVVSKSIEKAGKGATTVGIVIDFNKNLIDYSKSVNKSYGKALKVIGRATGITSIIASGNDFRLNPNWKNGIKLTVSVIGVLERTPTPVGFAIGVLDITGGTDWILDKTGETIEKWRE